MYNFLKGFYFKWIQFFTFYKKKKNLKNKMYQRLYKNIQQHNCFQDL